MNVTFPASTGKRCLMMPYIQGRPESVPEQYRTGYEDILEKLVFEPGEVGYLTIDESIAVAGSPHRGARAKYGRALHTEAGIIGPKFVWGAVRKEPGTAYVWGGQWGGSANVILEGDARILLANNLDDSCAIWPATHFATSSDGDIGDQADMYPYENAIMLKAGEVADIGILTPHESLPVKETCNRQFLRIISSGVHGREEYFTINPLI